MRTEKHTQRPDVAVVGGGAAGMMAAITAAEQGASVVLIEPNERLGKKLNITGKGRCNLTNCADRDELLKNIPGNGKFLYSALTAFDAHAAMRFFEGLGVPLKVERGRRVFPVSDRAFDVSAALEKRLRALGVRWRHAALKSLSSAEDGITLTLSDGALAARTAIIATGGLSYPATGSTGEGHRIAAALGHTITDLKPSLVALKEQGNDCAKLQGLSLRNVRLDVYEEKKRVYSEQGELLFTHFGLSGPLVLSASAHMRHIGQKSCRAVIDLKPALTEEMLDARLLRDFAAEANRDYQNALAGLLPAKLIPLFAARSGIVPEKKVHDLRKEERRAIITLLKGFEIPIAGTMPITGAIVTRGGVSVKEVDPKSMKSKLVKYLYFAGEILDVDAYTGGYNLQIAWSTGRAAGAAAAQEALGARAAGALEE